MSNKCQITQTVQQMARCSMKSENNLVLAIYDMNFYYSSWKLDTCFISSQTVDRKNIVIDHSAGKCIWDRKKFSKKIFETEVTGKIMTGKNWRFWTNSAIFFTAYNFPSHDKTRHNFPE